MSWKDVWEKGPQNYDKRTCILCNSDFRAPASRIGWIFRMHVERCEKATEVARQFFRDKHRWPKWKDKDQPKAMPDVASRFWAKVQKGEGCWEWTASTERGYGVLWYQRRREGAHRVSWLLSRGEIPPGMFVLHKCDNPPCVNPDHLFLGDNQANLRDAAAKGRLHEPVCKNGHVKAEVGVYVSMQRGLPTRRCRECLRAKNRGRYARLRAERLANGTR